MSILTKNTADFLKVLGDQTRLEILELLKKGSMSSRDIEVELDKKQPTISQQLKILYKSDLISYELRQNSNGNNTKYYTFKDKEIFNLLSSVNSFILKKNNEKVKNLADLDVLDTLS
ncbi:MAG: winged helix-turn-helix transcriptional regulator [Candidatus Lokiarchaeota archaeon]|nr:winged helix-turn-helix transcriptional regulator [Candidatus Lokiarchaeota archaeon]